MFIPKKVDYCKEFRSSEGPELGLGGRFWKAKVQAPMVVILTCEQFMIRHVQNPPVI
jgi:hypothetical protein